MNGRPFILVDTGPLVAFLNRRDRYHDWAVEQFKDIVPPLLTCESVLSEVLFLLKRISGGQKSLLELIRRRVLDLDFDLRTELDPVSRLLNRYNDRPMSLADACLVRMAERKKHAVVLTLDSDFCVYRKFGKTPIPLRKPE